MSADMRLHELRHMPPNSNPVHAGCAHVCAAPSVEMLQPAPVDRDVIVKLDPIMGKPDDQSQINTSLSGSQDAMVQGAPPPWG
jgi:hypothetical protein